VKKPVVFIAILFALFVSVLPVSVTAQDSGEDSAQARKLPMPEEVVEKLDSKLSLTDDQKAKITPIIADRQQQMRAVATDSSMRRFQKARKMKSIYKDSDKKIKAVLTDDQNKKYEEIQQEMKEQMKQRRQQQNNN
jgi:Spy/CpxP family protein refolding chaperone